MPRSELGPTARGTAAGVRPPAAPEADAVSDHAARPDAETRWRPPWPIRLGATMAPLRRGRGDPTMLAAGSTLWWAGRMADGSPVALALDDVDGAVRARAWGPGAWATVDRLPCLLGAGDDLTGFDPSAHPVMAAAFAGAAGWRMLRTERVLEALVPAVLEQRVTGMEARRAWRTLVLAHGERAPGPGPSGLVVPPTAAQWAALPSWAWHRAGVDPGRARTIALAAGRAASLERLSGRSATEARTALESLPGIGTWTSAEVAVRAWGDADAVSFGDFHLARDVVWALTGRFDGTDDDLADVLAPWAGQRARAARLVHAHAGGQPRRGPRAAVTDHRGW